MRSRTPAPPSSPVDRAKPAKASRSPVFEPWTDSPPSLPPDADIKRPAAESDEAAALIRHCEAEGLGAAQLRAMLDFLQCAPPAERDAGLMRRFLAAGLPLEKMSLLQPVFRLLYLENK